MNNTQEIRQLTLEAFGFDQLNPMQEQMLQSVSQGQDMLLLSPTGSGKTLAFLLPLWLVARQKQQEHKRFAALIIAPSRELVQQIGDVWQRLHTGIQRAICYGGHDLRTEQQQLAAIAAEPAYLIIGTPGRLKDHIERQNLQPAAFTHLTIDEFDKSLELGFEDEMHAIIDTLTSVEQRLLTSATHAVPIAPWTGFHNYLKIDFGSDQKEPERLMLYQVKSPVPDKLDTLRELLLSLLSDDQDEGQQQAVVFANYREAAERIAHFLSDHDIENALYHGGLDQEMRDKSIIRLRDGSIRVLVSTDLASRGLDLPEVAHVIHYHFPQSQEAYTHRNGRTARAGAEGAAYVIVGPDETLPECFPAKLPYYSLKRKAGLSIAPAASVTVYVGRGKKEKISKGDVLGFFTKNGGLKGSDIGRIDIMDHCAYVAIRREVAADALAKVKGLKIKGEKTHYLIVTGS